MPGKLSARPPPRPPPGSPPPCWLARRGTTNGGFWLRTRAQCTPENQGWRLISSAPARAPSRLAGSCKLVNWVSEGRCQGQRWGCMRMPACERVALAQAFARGLVAPPLPPPPASAPPAPPQPPPTHLVQQLRNEVLALGGDGRGVGEHQRLLQHVLKRGVPPRAPAHWEGGKSSAAGVSQQTGSRCAGDAPAGVEAAAVRPPTHPPPHVCLPQPIAGWLT
jgi:hypothetical protein